MGRTAAPIEFYVAYSITYDATAAESQALDLGFP